MSTARPLGSKAKAQVDAHRAQEAQKQSAHRDYKEKHHKKKPGILREIAQRPPFSQRLIVILAYFLAIGPAVSDPLTLVFAASYRFATCRRFPC